MLRQILCSLCVLALFGALAVADDKAKDQKFAVITKVDAKKNTVTMKLQGKDGKDVEKTFDLDKAARLLDRNGKAVAIDAFAAGDDVMVSERDGKLTEMKKAGKKDKGK